ncbi:MAG: addiction module antidote protein, HigA family [Rhodobiaceae bacterium]|nr:MAG: addiction module antidote protein, HigA family [Rhodobiaceae bacterium]
MRHKIPPTHPGEVLKEDFLGPMDMSANKLASHIGVPTNRITAIIRGERGVTAETALLFARAFGMSSDFWMGLQNSYDIETARDESEARISAVRKLPALNKKKAA